MSTTVTPAELGAFLDAVASAPVALRDVPRINSILARLVGLANQTGNIGVVPDEAEMRQKYIQEAAAKPAAVVDVVK